MKKATMAAEDCIDRLHAVVDDLARNGASTDEIASALLNAFVTTAKKGRQPLDALEAGAEVLSTRQSAPSSRQRRTEPKRGEEIDRLRPASQISEFPKGRNR